MSDDQLENEVLSQVAMDRRTFVRRIVLGTAFALPVIASFPLGALGAGQGQGTTPNQPGNQPRNLGELVSNEARSGGGGEIGQQLGGAAQAGIPPGKLFAPGQQY